MALIVITILMARRMHLADYGQFQTVWMYSSALGIAAAFGWPALLLAYPVQQVRQFLQNHFSKLCLFQLMLLAAAIASFAFTELPASLKWLCSFLLLVQATYLVFDAWLVKKGRTNALMWLGFVYALSFLTYNSIALYRNEPLQHLLLGNAVLQAARLILMALLIRKPKSIATPTYPGRLMIQWQFLGWTEVLNSLARWLDKLLLVYFISAADFALFFNGTYEIPFAGLLVSAAGNIITVQCAATNDVAEKVRAFRWGFKLLSLIMFPLFAFFMFFGSDCFGLLLGERYGPALPLFYISLLLLPLRTNYYGSILQTTGNASVILKGSVLDLVLTLLLVVLLYHYAGLRGAACAPVIATYVQAVYYLYHSARIVQQPITALLPWRLLVARLTVALALFALLYVALINLKPEWRLLVAAVVTTVTVVVGLYVFYKKENSILLFPLRSR